jgi:hypothetical protein
LTLATHILGFIVDNANNINRANQLRNLGLFFVCNHVTCHRSVEWSVESGAHSDVRRSVARTTNKRQHTRSIRDAERQSRRAVGLADIGNGRHDLTLELSVVKKRAYDTTLATLTYRIASHRIVTTQSVVASPTNDKIAAHRQTNKPLPHLATILHIRSPINPMCTTDVGAVLLLVVLPGHSRGGGAWRVAIITQEV